MTPYYIESITTKKGFWAAPCGNLFSYLIGWCNPPLEKYILMGEDTPHTLVLFHNCLCFSVITVIFCRTFPILGGKRKEKKRKAFLLLFKKFVIALVENARNHWNFLVNLNYSNVYLLNYFSSNRPFFLLFHRFHSKRARGIFYLSTNAHRPYARGLPVKKQQQTSPKRSSYRQY